MKKKLYLKIFACIGVLVITLSALAACGAGNYDVGYEKDEMLDAGESNDSAGSTITSGNKNEMAEGSENSSADAYKPKIIKTATVNAETKKFGDAVAQIEAKVKELGGYIEKSDIQDQNAYYGDDGYGTTKYASYVIRIPQENLDLFLSETGALLNITSQSSSAEDVGNEYYDIQARVSVLETERQILEKMLSESTDVSEMITLESRLYDVIYEIESYKTALKVYDGKVAYSTVNLTVTEVAELTPANKDMSFGARFKEAVKESADNFLAFCQDLVIFLVYASPVLLVLFAILLVNLVIALIIVMTVKRKIAKRKAKKAKSENQ